jgi:aminoglycoside 6'-N-acetyltransferase I
VKIAAFPIDDASVRRQAAELLVEAFPHPNGWPTMTDALEQVDDVLVPAGRCRVALDGDELVGWIGSMPGFRGRVWELHPLVVRANAQGRGIGRELVYDLERTLFAEGAVTLWVGTDDDLAETSLAGVDVYPAPLDHLRALRAPARHPLGFYQRMGFALCGILPDANGFGLPNFMLARRLVGTRA